MVETCFLQNKCKKETRSNGIVLFYSGNRWSFDELTTTDRTTWSGDKWMDKPPAKPSVFSWQELPRQVKGQANGGAGYKPQNRADAKAG
jgi:hypothetical protein